MIDLLFKFSDKDGCPLMELRVKQDNDTIIFSDTYIDMIINKVKGLKEKAKSWDIYINCSMATIVVENYSLSDTLYLFGFNDVKSTISIFKSKNIKLHLVNIDIKHLEIEKCELLLANSKVDELYSDMELFMNMEGDNSVLDDYFGKFDLRSCIIRKVYFHQNVSFFSINECSINNIDFTFRGTRVLTIRGLFINNSKIETFNCNFHSDKFTLCDSYINSVNFKSCAIIKSIEIKKTKIDNVFGCDERTITDKTLDGWYLIKKSNYKVNTNLYCLSGYNICKSENQAKIDNEKNRLKRFGIRLSDIFLRWSIGYAYKPANAILFTLLCILSFAVLYSCVDAFPYLFCGSMIYNIKYLPTIFNTISDNIYWSGITFTTIGYGEIGIHNWLSKILAIVEGCFGISTMSLFVIALVKKYLD